MTIRNGSESSEVLTRLLDQSSFELGTHAPIEPSILVMLLAFTINCVLNVSAKQFQSVALILMRRITSPPSKAFICISDSSRQNVYEFGG